MVVSAVLLLLLVGREEGARFAGGKKDDWNDAASRGAQANASKARELICIGSGAEVESAEHQQGRVDGLTKTASFRIKKLKDLTRHLSRPQISLRRGAGPSPLSRRQPAEVPRT